MFTKGNIFNHLTKTSIFPHFKQAFFKTLGLDFNLCTKRVSIGYISHVWRNYGNIVNINYFV